MTHRPILVAALGAVLAVWTAPAQAQREAAGRRIIVRALANGAPVTDLKAEELSIRIDGKPRQVAHFELITVGAAQPPATSAPPAAPALPPPFATTAATAPAAASGGREFLIVLDEESVAAGREDTVRRAVAALMADAAPSDRFGLVSLRTGGLNVQPTIDRKAMTDVLAKFQGGGSAREDAGDMLCRAKRSLGALAEIFNRSPTGRTVILISPGLLALQDAAPRLIGGMDQRDYELCQIRSNEFDALGTAASTSPANLYVLHYADGAATAVATSEVQQGLQNIAGSTGAEFMRLVGGSENAVQRIGRETASYYIATLDDAPGPVRRIDARVSREGVKIQARPVGLAGAAPSAASAKGMSPRDMVKTTAVFSDVPLRAAGFVSRQGPHELKVITLFEPVDSEAKLTAASVALIDEKGSAKVWTARSEELARYPVRADLALPAGKYRVRVAATTAGGGGTVDYDVTGELQDAAPLKMGSMLLGVTSDKGFAPKLQFTKNDATAVGLVEVYSVLKGANVTVEFEALEANGESRGAAPGVVRNGSTEDARIVMGGFDIGTLEPGDYTMRAKISVDGKLAGTASRTLRKTN